MKVYVQGLSALAHYRSADAETEVERTSRHAQRLEEATGLISDIREMRIYRLGIGDYGPDAPLEVLVPDRSKRGRSRSVRTRVWSTPIKGNAFRQVDKEIYVSSPEFVFLQMATKLPFAQLVALGMELCGTYRRNVRVPKLGTDEWDSITEFNAPVLTTPRRLKGFLDQMKSAPGINQANKALEYILPNSASPMETVIYLLLCLPRHMGGYGLPKPILNPKLTFSAAGRRYTLRRSARPDLFWRKVRLDLEANGGDSHDENRRAADSMRRKALERGKVEVIELTKEEIYSEEMFHATAVRIARKLKKDVRPEYERNFIERRRELRKQLLYEGDEDKWDDEMRLELPAEAIDGEWTLDSQGIDAIALGEIWLGDDLNFEDGLVWEESWNPAQPDEVFEEENSHLLTYGAGAL